MKLIRDKVAGLNIHRDTVVACCRVHHQGRRVALTKGTFATTTKGLTELVDWLREASVTTIAMEATGVYWKPVYYSLAGTLRGALSMQRPAREECSRSKDRP